MRGRDFDSVLEVLEMRIEKGVYRDLTAIYDSIGTIRANRVKNEGHKVISVGEQYAYYKASYQLRDGNKVKVGWRVKDMDSGVTYVIEAIIPDRRLRMLTINCIAVNPNGTDADLPE